VPQIAGIRFSLVQVRKSEKAVHARSALQLKLMDAADDQQTSSRHPADIQQTSIRAMLIALGPPSGMQPYYTL